MRLILLIAFLSGMLSNLSAQQSYMRAMTALTGMGGRAHMATFSDGSPVVVQETSTAGLTRGFTINRHGVKLQLDWSKNYEQDHRMTVSDMEVLNDTILVSGIVYDKEYGSFFLASFDSSGTAIAFYVLLENEGAYLYNTCIHPQGGIVAFGFRMGPTPAGIGNMGRVIYRIQSNGELIWSQYLDWQPNWGYGGVLPNGDIVSSGSGQFVCLTAGGTVKWANSYPDHHYTLPPRAHNGRIFWLPFSYNPGLSHLISTDENGKSPRSSVDFYSETVSDMGVLPNGNLVVLGRHFITHEKVNMRLVEIQPSGALVRIQNIDNFFGYAPTGALRDGCSYSYHLSPNGIPYVFGMAAGSGYFILRLKTDGSYACQETSYESTPAPVPEPANYATGRQYYALTVDTISPMRRINPPSYQDSLLCYVCDSFTRELPRDTTLCPGDSLLIDFRSAGAAVSWRDGYVGLRRVIRQTGIYHYRLQNDCDTLADSISVFYYPAVSPELSYAPEFPVTGEEVVFTTQVPASVAAFWWLSEGDSISADNPWVSRFEKNGSYLIKLVYRSTDGCLFYDSALVTSMLIDVWLPNSFTPNGDGINDLFGPVGQGVKSYKLSVYNRWGEKIHEGASLPWDGRFKGRQVMDGIYLYELRWLDDEGVVHRQRGMVSVWH